RLGRKLRKIGGGLRDLRFEPGDRTGGAIQLRPDLAESRETLNVGLERPQFLPEPAEERVRPRRALPGLVLGASEILERLGDRIDGLGRLVLGANHQLYVATGHLRRLRY